MVDLYRTVSGSILFISTCCEKGKLVLYKLLILKNVDLINVFACYNNKKTTNWIIKIDNISKRSKNI